MISADEKALCEKLASLPGWSIAEMFNCGYEGDADPIYHGGLFYDVRDWEQHGYANSVEFFEDSETEHLVVQRGTIYRPTSDKDWESCWSCVGISKDSPERENIHAQISAVRAWSGTGCDGTGYPDLKEFDLETWKEWRIWRSVHEWIKALGE